VIIETSLLIYYKTHYSRLRRNTIGGDIEVEMNPGYHKSESSLNDNTYEDEYATISDLRYVN
jgi:hypothetical protein